MPTTREWIENKFKSADIGIVYKQGDFWFTAIHGDSECTKDITKLFSLIENLLEEREEAKEKLTLGPKDYLVTANGLKLENITEDLMIEVETGFKITVYPQERTGNPTN